MSTYEHSSFLSPTCTGTPWTPLQGLVGKQHLAPGGTKVSLKRLLHQILSLGRRIEHSRSVVSWLSTHLGGKREVSKHRATKQ
eukprot:3499268-Amphidinium_carterae.1